MHIDTVEMEVVLRSVMIIKLSWNIYIFFFV